MCFSFQASVAAATTGIVTATFVLVFLHDRVEDALVRQSAAVLPSLLLAPAAVQLADAWAHVQVGRGGQGRSDWRPAILCWLAICAQPVVLSVAAGALLGGAWTWLLLLNAALIALSVVLSLGFDVPLGEWLVVEIVRKEGRLANVVHGPWAYGAGAAYRTAAYALTLAVGGAGIFTLAVRVGDRADPYAETVSVYMIALGAGLLALWALSEAYCNFVELARRNVSSVWCAVSLVATTAAGLYLMADKEADRGIAALFFLSLVGTYALSFVVAKEA